MAETWLLDVGNCDPDHAMIRGMLTKHFDVRIDRVMFVEDALTKMRERPYALVLFNRLVFADGSEGIELLRKAKADPALKGTPMMMISNYGDAQQASVAAGGEPGFGKADVADPKTAELLRKYLSPKG
ncbi:MAG: hypothetical protein HZA51_03925 [Planctomycetes bacterium]|nr:hypothetical protein [Planctomycetota bacterium]